MGENNTNIDNTNDKKRIQVNIGNEKKKKRNSLKKIKEKRIRSKKKKNKKRSLGQKLQISYRKSRSKIIQILTSLSNYVENVIKSTLGLKIFSLFIAIGFAILVQTSISDSLGLGTGEIITGVPVNVIYNEELYVVEGVPENIELSLFGDKTEVLLTREYRDYEVYLDLTNYEPGEYTLDLSYRNISQKLKVRITPSTVNVKISDKVSRTIEISEKQINTDKLNPRYVIENLELDFSEVHIQGSREKVESVSFVSALIDVSKITKTGEGILLKDIPLLAYDGNGELVDVEFSSGNLINATIDVSSPSKDLKVEIKPVGDLKPGFAIEGYDINPSFIKVYGPQNVLDELTTFEIEIDVDGLDGNKIFTELITKPSGIRFMDTDKIKIEVLIGEESTKTISDQRIISENLTEGLKVNILNADEKEIDVILRGAESQIADITENDIVVYVNLLGYGEGEHTVLLHVRGKNPNIKYELEKTEIDILISK